MKAPLPAGVILLAVFGAANAADPSVSTPVYKAPPVRTCTQEELMNRRKSLLPRAVIAASPALAADLPHRKPGLWEITYSSCGGHDTTNQYCIDAAVDEVMGVGGLLDADECPKIMQRSGGAATIDFACTMKDKPATGHAVVSGSFDGAYTMTWTVQDDNVRGGVLTATETWLGPCAVDQRPGDIVMLNGAVNYFANGFRLNILDMIKAKSPPL